MINNSLIVITSALSYRPRLAIHNSKLIRSSEARAGCPARARSAVPPSVDGGCDSHAPPLRAGARGGIVHRRDRAPGARPAPGDRAHGPVGPKHHGLVAPGTEPRRSEVGGRDLRVLTGIHLSRGPDGLALGGNEVDPIPGPASGRTEVDLVEPVRRSRSSRRPVLDDEAVEPRRRGHRCADVERVPHPRPTPERQRGGADRRPRLAVESPHGDLQLGLAAEPVDREAVADSRGLTRAEPDDPVPELDDLAVLVDGGRLDPVGRPPGGGRRLDDLDPAAEAAGSPVPGRGRLDREVADLRPGGLDLELPRVRRGRVVGHRGGRRKGQYARDRTREEHDEAAQALAHEAHDVSLTEPPRTPSPRGEAGSRTSRH